DVCSSDLPLSADQCQYRTSLPPRVYQSHSTACQSAFIRFINWDSAATEALRYWRNVIKPCTKREVSTRSPPLSLALKGSASPVFPFYQCDHAPWKRSADSRKLTISFSRSIPCSREINPRSIPTIMAISPNPLPPLVTESPEVFRSRAIPRAGCAKS